MLEAFNNAQSILFLIASTCILVFAAIVLPPWRKMYYELISALSWVILFTWFIISSQVKSLKRWLRKIKAKRNAKHISDNSSKHVNNLRITGCENVPPVMSDQMN